LSYFGTQRVLEENRIRWIFARAELGRLNEFEGRNTGADEWQERMNSEMEDTKQPTFGARTPIGEKAPLQAMNLQPIAGANLAEVAHEARNMVAALGLYCDLLEEPGVLAATHRHYGAELQLVAAASRRLVDRLMSLGGPEKSSIAPSRITTQFNPLLSLPEIAANKPKTTKYWDEMPPKLIGDLAWELQTKRNLLAALAGPAITVTVNAVGGALPVRLSSEDLTRVLVNLAKNAADAMPDGGRIQLILRECPAAAGEGQRLILNFEDNGLGIPPKALEKIFEIGYTTRSKTGCAGESWQTEHRGLGLSITRSIVESAGGQIRAANRDPLGACFQIELPVRV
jgi:signal transduction histidine kinase